MQQSIDTMPRMSARAGGPRLRASEPEQGEEGNLRHFPTARTTEGSFNSMGSLSRAWQTRTSRCRPKAANAKPSLPP